VGSTAVTECVVARRAADSAKMPPPQPMSRYLRLWPGGRGGAVLKHRLMKGCRCWFMRWRRRLEPWGSHHSEAKVLKWETSVSLTELPTWLALGGLEPVAWVRMEYAVRTAGLKAARVDDCVATSLRKGAGNEKIVLVRIVGGDYWYSQHSSGTWTCWM
jgi:hypothetical protein